MHGWGKKECEGRSVDDRVMTSPRHQGNSSRALLTEEQLQNFNIVLVSADMLFSVYSGKKMRQEKKEH